MATGSGDPPRTLRLATRGSPLALRQAQAVARALEALSSEVRATPVVVRTRGDLMTEVALDRIGGQGVFVKEVQAAVLEGRAEVAVHSAKDLPSENPAGLALAAVPERADPRDALVGCALHRLPVGGVVATGSARRRAQLANLRPDLTFVELRGNLGTRLDRAAEGGVDAVVTAMAALGRLEALDRLDEALEPAVMLPQVGQGALALECREDDQVTAGLLDLVDHRPSHRCLEAERAVLGSLGASCATPFGALAAVGSQGSLTLEAMAASGEGRIVVRARGVGHDPVPLGHQVAKALVDHQGASVIPGFTVAAGDGQ